MTSPLRLLVVGAGAVGGYFGAHLAAAGRDVTFLVRPARAQLLERDGLQVLSPGGDLTLRPQLAVTGALGATYDVILLSVKAYALDAALDDFAPAVGAETTIVPLLNGMRHVDRLIERFGEGPVLGGLCYLATQLDDDGRIVQLGDLQILRYGERDGSSSARVAALDGLFGGAGFTAVASSTIVHEMWEKWVMLAAVGGITCLLRGNVGEIEAAPGGAELALAFLDECAAIAAAAGEAPSPEFLARTSALITARGSSGASSMYRDLQAGRPVEADHILGDLLARGRAAGIATPLLAAAFANLRIYQNRLSR
jgi:2-dehydropantoate 2-reductase